MVVVGEVGSRRAAESNLRWNDLSPRRCLMAYWPTEHMEDTEGSHRRKRRAQRKDLPANHANICGLKGWGVRFDLPTSPPETTSLSPACCQKFHRAQGDDRSSLLSRDRSGGSGDVRDPMDDRVPVRFVRIQAVAEAGEVPEPSVTNTRHRRVRRSPPDRKLVRLLHGSLRRIRCRRDHPVKAGTEHRI